MHDCVPFLQQQRDQALSASSDAGDSSPKHSRSAGTEKTRDYVAQL